MQRQGGGAPTWSVAVHWVCRLWGFPGGADQGQPLPVFCPGAASISYKAICRWLLLVLGLDTASRGLAVSQGQLLLVLGLVPLSERYGAH